MDTTATLDPPRTDLDAGREGTVVLSVRNDSRIVEDYTLQVVGNLAEFCTVEPSHVSVYPGQAATALLTVRPPRSPDVPAGEHFYGVHVQPAKQTGDATVAEGAIEVLPFYDTVAELSPQTARSKGGSRYRVAVENRGNAPVAVVLAGKSASDELGLSLGHSELTVGPGSTGSSEIRAEPVKRLWRKSPVVYPFTVMVRPDGGPEITLAGTQYQDPVLPAWTLKALIGLVVLAAALALGIWTRVEGNFPPWREATDPETTDPQTTAPGTVGPEETDAATVGPETTGPETTEPETSVPATVDPETTAPETTSPQTTAPELTPTVPDTVVLAAPPGPIDAPASITTELWPENPWSGTVDVTSIVLDNPEGYAGRVSIELWNAVTGTREQMLYRAELSELGASQELVLDASAEQDSPAAGDGSPAGDEDALAPIERFQLNAGYNLLLAMRCYELTEDGEPQAVDECAVTFTVDGEVTEPGTTG